MEEEEDAEEEISIDVVCGSSYFIGGVCVCVCMRGANVTPYQTAIMLNFVNIFTQSSNSVVVLQT